VLCVVDMVLYVGHETLRRWALAAGVPARTT
jgi:hypothetical protein